jgi:hypothetical protein
LAVKTLSIIAKSVNGEVYEFPKTVVIPCNELLPVGKSLIRVYDTNNCIVVYELYLVRYNNDVFGTEQFNSLSGFNQYISSACACCIDDPCCYLLYNGCYITFNGERIVYNTN